MTVDHVKIAVLKAFEHRRAERIAGAVAERLLRVKARIAHDRKNKIVNKAGRARRNDRSRPKFPLDDLRVIDDRVRDAVDQRGKRVVQQADIVMIAFYLNHPCFWNSCFYVIQYYKNRTPFAESKIRTAERTLKYMFAAMRLVGCADLPLLRTGTYIIQRFPVKIKSGFTEFGRK